MTYDIVNAAYRSSDLHRDAGTFYSSQYEDAERVYHWFDSLCWAWQMLNDEMCGAADLFLPCDEPVYDRVRFLPVTITEEEFRNGQTVLPYYGEDDTVYDVNNHYYGKPYHSVAGVIPLDDAVCDVSLICDLPVDPAHILLANEDFAVHNHSLVLCHDPFETFVLPDVTDSGSRVLTLWLRDVKIDRQSMQQRSMFVLRAAGDSSEILQNLVRAILTCVTTGTGFHSLHQLIGALFGIPRALETEQIIAAGSTLTSKWIATARHVYRTNLYSEFRYAVGDTITKSAFLTDGIETVAENTYQSRLPLIIPRVLLGSGYRGSLIFLNETVPIEEPLGKKYATFPIIGNAKDIERFWTRLYEHVPQSFLYDYSRGSTINPAQFVYSNVYAGRLFLFFLYYGKLDKNRPPVINTALLRDLTPPGAMVLLIPVIEAGTHRYLIQSNEPQISIGIGRTLPAAVLTVTVTLHKTASC